MRRDIKLITSMREQKIGLKGSNKINKVLFSASRLNRVDIHNSTNKSFGKVSFPTLHEIIIKTPDVTS